MTRIIGIVLLAAIVALVISGLNFTFKPPKVKGQKDLETKGLTRKEK